MDFSETSKKSKNATNRPKAKARPRPIGFFRVNCLLLLVSALYKATHAFDLIGMEVEPKTVQYDGADLTFWAKPEQAIPAPGYLKLRAPSDIVTKTTGLKCRNIFTGADCVVTSSRNEFRIELDQDIEAGEQFEFRISKAIVNPDSSKPSGTFSLLTSVGELENGSPVMNVKAEPGRMGTYLLDPESDIVGESTTLVVKFSAEHDIPVDADILMIFPMWNAENPVTDQQKPFIQGNVSCRAQRDLNPDLICIFNNEKNRLLVRKATKVRIPSGKVVSFTVSGFKNPIEATFFDGFEIKTAMQYDDEECYDGEFCLIDEDVTTVQASAAARLQSPTLLPIDTESELSGMIQEINSMRLDFYLPVPLNPGCQIEIILPEQYSVDDVVYLTTQNAFGRFQTYREDTGNLYVNVEKRSLKLDGACPYYIANNNVATIDIFNLRQPNYEKETDSLTIIITSENDALIARVDEGVTFIPEGGSLKVVTSALTTTVQEPTLVTFELVPQHAIYMADNPEVIIEFPPEVEVNTRQCEIQDVRMDGYEGNIGKECWVDNQIFQVKKFLPQDYIPAAEGEPDKKIYFTLGLVYNSVSVQPVTGLNVLIQAHELYAIDEFTGDLDWIATTGSFSSTKIAFTSSVAYASEVTYTISFTPDHLVPQNGYIEIDFPKQISVPDYSFSQSSCRALQDSAFGTNQISCQFIDAGDLSDPYRLRDPDTPSHYTMRIDNAFRRTSVEGGQEYSLEIPGLRNPIQTVPTNSFKFRTYDGQGRPIDELNDGTTIRMDLPSDLEIVIVSMVSYTNSALTSYTVTMVPTVPVWEMNLILITFPDQITLPPSSVDLNCESLFTSLLADVKCTYLSDASDVPSNIDYKPEKTVRVALTFPSGVEQIDPLDRFSITMEDVKNPTTTQTTDSFQVRITDSNYIEINSKLKEITVTTNNAANVKQIARPETSPQPGVEASFYLDFYPEHAIAPGGGILVVYPPETLINKLQTLTAEVTVDNLVVDPSLLVLEADISARALRILNLVQTQAAYVPKPGAKIRVELIGLRTPYSSDETKSFVMTSFNYIEGKYYFIDTVTAGMTINSKCNFPCKDCSIDDPGKCLSCYSLEDLQDEDGELDSNADLRPFLQESTCVEKCAADRYYDATTDRCEKCDPTCLKCTERADKCTKCGIDEFLFLHQDQCLTSCPDQFIEDPSANKCKPCQANCLTCEGLPTSCTSCDTNSAYKFFFHESCIDECIPDISVQVGDKCVECDATCKTCSGTPQTCTSCESHMKLDPFNQKCENRCEAEVQVFNEETLQCEFCADTCTKCAGSRNTCTACKPGYVLNFDQTCRETCGAENQTPIDGICAACEKPCYGCEGSISTCTSCIDDYALYLGTKCVQYCPIKYENRDDVCVYEGLVCPAGFELNQAKDGCVPLTFDCQPGYQINKQETACVPKPGSAVPFPFLLCAILLTLLVLGSYLKDKHFTKVVTNLIACIGSLELIMYGMMAAYAYSLDETLILMFVGIGFFGLLASNILFVSYYRQQICVKDQVFVKWLHFFPKTRFWMPLISLLLNFKMSKMFYSGFYGLDSTLARFGRHQQFFYLQRLSAYFSFVFCYAFIFIADALIIIKIDQGYQLFILAIETIVLQIIIIILTCIEFRKGATKLLNSHQDQLSMIKPNMKGKQFRVMGGIEEDDDYQAGIPDIDEDTLIRSKIKTEQLEIGLRQQALARILNQVGSHPTEKGVDIKDCLTKFDPERIKMRRCFSMSNLGSDDGSWKAEGEDSDDPNGPLKVQQLKTPGENFDGFEEEEPRARRYSFPLSPRRQANLPNTLIFERAIEDIKEANKDFLIDNVYTDTKPVLDPFAKRKVKTVSRRTQTYLRELLHVDGEEVHESDMEVLMEEEAELDFDFAKGLINKVIDHISSADESAPVQEKKKKVVKKVFKPKKEIPDFELADIMGDFEIDDMGNFIIMRGDGGELLDQRERLVNRRGYLIDRFGNVINNLGNIIFKAIELDVDDEIPAPFGFEKRKKNLLKLGDENQFKVESYRQSVQTGDHQASQLNMDDEELLDKEVTAIKEQIKQQPSQDASPKAQSQAQDDEGALGMGQNMDYSIKDGQTSQVENDVIDEEDNLEAEIDQLVQKKVPKKRKALKQAKVNKKLNNMPPKRIKPEDVKGLFPHLSIEHDEQKRLAKIAGSISGLANQLADKQRQQQIIEDRKRSATVHSQQLDWNNQHDDQKLDRIRQDQLNEIMLGSEIAATEKFGHDLVRDQSLLMQDRPGSNTQSHHFAGVTRQMSAIARPQRGSDSGLRRHRSSNKPIGRDRTDDLYRVYGQAADLSGLHDEHQQDLTMPRGVPEGAFQTAEVRAYKPRRGQSGRPEGRMAGLETIYMTKVPKLKPPMNMNVTSQSGMNKRNFSASRRHDHNPFRPTMDRFADDPSELNVNTTMQYGSMNQGGGRDILEMAERLDKMQRDYLSHNRGGIATQKLTNAPLASQPQLLDQSGRDFTVPEGDVSGVQSQYPQQPNYPGLQGMSRTASGQQRFAPNSEANKSMDKAQQDNWVGEQ